MDDQPFTTAHVIVCHLSFSRRRTAAHHPGVDPTAEMLGFHLFKRRWGLPRHGSPTDKEY